MWDIIGGAITGLLGNIVTSFVNYKTLKLKNDHEREMITLQTDAMKEEAKMNIAVTKAEIEGKIELADSDAYMESIKAGNQKSFSDKWIDKLFSVEGKLGRFFAIPCAVLIATAFGFVDWLRGFMRPSITIYLIVLSTIITYMAWDVIQVHGLETISGTEALEMFKKTTSIIIYLTVSCVTWWFGDRRTGKFIQKMYGNGND